MAYSDISDFPLLVLLRSRSCWVWLIDDTPGSWEHKKADVVKEEQGSIKTWWQVQLIIGAKNISIKLCAACETNITPVATIC